MEEWRGSLAGMSDVTVLFLVVFLCAQLWYPDAAAPVSIPLSPPEGLLAFHASNVDVYVITTITPLGSL